MPRIYSLITAFLAATGSAGLVIGGEINPLLAPVGVLLVAGYYRAVSGRRPAPRWAVGLSSLLTLAVFGAESLATGDVFLAVAHLTIAFQAIKAFDLRDPWDYLQVYFVALLQLVIASEMTSSVVFGAVFIVFMVMLVSAMVLSHFLKEGRHGAVPVRKPLVVIVLLTMATTSALFLLIPRTPYRLLGKGHMRHLRTAGFSEKVDFGSFGTVKLDPSVVMRVEVTGGRPLARYWRGMSLDEFDGVSWRQSDRMRRPVTRTDDAFTLAPYDPDASVVQRIYREPIDSDVIFGLAPVKAVRADGFRLFVDSEQAIYLPGSSSRRVAYTVFSMPEESLPGGSARGYLQLPAIRGLGALAERAAGGAAGAGGRAARIEDFLKRNYAYSLTTRRPPAGVSPIEYFLFDSKKGYCEHYATSMVLMLRSLGIPARIVTGFYGGETNTYGDYVILRQSDAHSWVEALIEGRWVRYDPTPAAARAAGPSTIALLLDSVVMAWSRYVVGFSSEDQRLIVRTFAFPFSLPSVHGSPSLRPNPYFLIIPAGVAVVFGVSALLRRMRTMRHGYATEGFLRLRRVLKKKGYRAEGATPAVIRRMTEGSPMGGAVEEFLRMYEEERFGGRRPGRNQRQAYERLIREIRRSPSGGRAGSGV